MKTSFYSLVLIGFIFGFFFMTALPTRLHNHFIGPVAEAYTPMIAPITNKKDEPDAISRATASPASRALKAVRELENEQKKTTLVARKHKRQTFKSPKRVTGRSKHARSRAAKIASTAKRVAKKMDSRGYCYRGVKRALKPFGVNLHGQSAYMAKNILKEDKRFKVVAVNEFDNLQPGDILVHGKSKSHRNGHIAVYLGAGQEASDHVQRLVTSRKYGTSVVFRMTQ